MASIREKIGPSTPTYLTFDIDGIDPSLCPGTGTPEVGGLTVVQVSDFLFCFCFKWFLYVDYVVRVIYLCFSSGSWDSPRLRRPEPRGRRPRWGIPDVRHDWGDGAHGRKPPLRDALRLAKGSQGKSKEAGLKTCVWKWRPENLLHFCSRILNYSRYIKLKA